LGILLALIIAITSWRLHLKHTKLITDNRRAFDSDLALQLPHPTSPFGLVTLSIGCATCSKETSSSEKLIKKADARLYLAKRNGHNRLVCSNKYPFFSSKQPSPY
jgi:diguanylate cyclase (GGDEF)-like protein